MPAISWGLLFQERPAWAQDRGLEGRVTLLSHEGYPTPGSLDITLPFSGLKMKVPETFHLPAGRTLASKGVHLAESRA